MKFSDWKNDEAGFDSLWTRIKNDMLTKQEN